MTGPEIVAWMRGRGVRVWAEDGKLRLSAPPGVVTAKMRERLTGSKGAIMAALTGEPQPTDTPGIVYDPAGGVRFANPPDLRGLLADRGEAMGWPVVGEARWLLFCGTAPLGQVADTLLFLDDKA